MSAVAGLDYVALLDRLERLGAAQVVFSEAPVGSALLFDRARRYGNVVFGRVPRPRPGAPDLVWLPALSPAASDLPVGISGIAPASGGIYRRQAVAWGDSGLPYLEIVAASELKGTDFMPPEGSYRVNFLAGEGYLPRVDSSAVLAGHIIPDLVLDRSVVVGSVVRVYNTGLHIPLRDQPMGVSLAEFQAYALDTLLRDAAIHTLPASATLPLLLALACISSLLYQWLSPRLALRVSAELLVLYVLLAWLCLARWYLWLPLVPIMLAHVVLGFAIFTYRRIVQDRSLAGRTVRVSARVNPSVTPAGFYAAHEPWQDIIRLTNQMLGLKRQVFLECIPGKTQVRVVATDNCTSEDIIERQRDYRNMPCATALETRAPVLLRERLFMQPLNEAEAQYLVPLLYISKPEGFWVFGMDPSQCDATADFHATVMHLASEIATLTLYRRQWHERQRRHSGFLMRTLRLESPQDPYQKLVRVSEQMEHRFNQMEGVSQAMVTAFVLYDPFGHVLYTNNRMQEWARQAELRLFDMTALDLVSALLRQKPGLARDYLRRLLTEREPLNTVIAMPGHEDNRYLLRIRALAQRDDAIDFGSPFELLGMLFEISDIDLPASLIPVNSLEGNLPSLSTP